ncbi:MAG: arginine--tRNA ligase [bacterium]
MDIKVVIKNRIIAALGDIGVADAGEIELETPPEGKMGDIAFPCFGLSKILKKSPNEIAKELAEILKPPYPPLEKGGEMVEDVDAAGGYVNFFYKRDVFLNNVLRDVAEKGDEYGTKSQRSKACPEFVERVKSQKLRIMVEYSGPNTNKPLHLGHGRNSFIGMSISNLLENAGAEVIKANIVNDRGAHICKSMIAYKKYGNNETPESSGIKGDHFVGKYYTMFGEKLKENPDMEEEVKECLRKWEAGDEEVMALWEKMNEWYYQGVEKTYEKIGSEFDKYYYESENYKHGKEIVMDALSKKIVYKKEDGAIAIDLSDEGLDEKILLRSDGTSVYITQDLYTAKIRFEEFNLNKLIYVVACEQEYHFKVLFKILARLGYAWTKNCCHLSYGMVNIPSGKLKSREGTKVDLDDLVENLKQMAMAAIKEKHGKDGIEGKEGKEGEDAVEERAMKIGLAALKFMILKVNPAKSVMFNPSEAISFEGDTGPYVLYAYTRIMSILRKGGQELRIKSYNVILNDEEVKDPVAYTSHSGILRPPGARIQNDALGVLVSDEEMRMAKMIYEFTEVLEHAAIDYNPSLLANYLLEISSAFNKFYHIHKVLDAETGELRDMRIALIEAVAVVIERGMGILGIEMVEEM